MRLSVKSNDIGHLLFELLVQAGRSPQIFLDGIRQQGCVITVDDSEDWLDRYVIDADGSFKYDPKVGDPLVERVHGKVRIMLDPQER